MNRNASRFLRTARLAAPALAAVTLTMAFDILVADQAALDTVPTGAGCEFVVR
ncbi:hypothetical protein AB0D94_07445 [Streptomyces sp. NPDC048255]|uniref:hypothetical protein n=1 Tax=Streptomyces sp. NPDC048255 TaxID=3154713 RepID=UPI0033C4494B